VKFEHEKLRIDNVTIFRMTAKPLVRAQCKPEEARMEPAVRVMLAGVLSQPT